MDHKENCCIFDTTQYTGIPDAQPCEKTIDVPEIIRALDKLYAQGRENEAQGFLEERLNEARSIGVSGTCAINKDPICKYIRCIYRNSRHIAVIVRNRTYCYLA